MIFKKLNSQHGFTLLEVLISLTLLSFLSYFTTQSMRGALDSKVKIQTELDGTSLLLNSIQVIKRDIKLAFNYRNDSVDLYNESHKISVKNCETKVEKSKKSKIEKDTDLSKCKQIDDSYKVRVHKKFAQFVGKKNELYFTTLSFIRSRSSQPLSDQAEIGYYLTSCRSRSDKKKRSQCLWRRSSPYVDNDVEKGGEDRVLVENVENLRFRYLSPHKETDELVWRENWMSDERGDKETKGFFPQAVEITLRIKRKKIGTEKNKDNRKSLAMTVIAPINFLNNPEKEKKKKKKNE